MMRANLQLTDYDVDGQPQPGDFAVRSATLSVVLTQELDGAEVALGLTTQEILLAALGRTIVRVIGEGVVSVDLAGRGADVHAVELTCSGPAALPATDAIVAAHRAVDALATHRAVNGTAARPLGDALFVHGDPGGTTAEVRGHGHALELHARRRDGVVALDWWYDVRAFDPYTVEELSEQFPYALIELTSEATVPAVGGTELALAH